MTIQPLKKKYSKEEFRKYCRNDVWNALSAQKTWTPTAVTLHNTYNPNLKLTDEHVSGKWTYEQLIDNWWTRYEQLKFFSGPHVFVYRDGIYTGCPLWIRGTHSPGFNKDHFGLEVTGDYATEVMPKEIRDYAVYAFACLYELLEKLPNVNNFKFHGEDPKTTHRGCPGKNVGLKEEWVYDVTTQLKEFKTHA